MDPIADMLTAIRNAQASRLETTTVHASKMKVALLTILKNQKMIKGFTVSTDTAKPTITIELQYMNRLPVISHLRRISKPGLRVYAKRTNLPRPLRGMGFAILSTPAGLITDSEARKLGVGGEIICEVW
jgi:small subunit ribosomal protein S8